MAVRAVFLVWRVMRVVMAFHATVLGILFVYDFLNFNDKPTVGCLGWFSPVDDKGVFCSRHYL